MPAAQEQDSADAPEIWYLLDPDDRIIDVGGDGWTLAGDGLVGASIYDHVAGHFTRRFLKNFLGEARQGQAQTRQCYRCDSPDAKRLMAMSAKLESPQVLRITHRMLAARSLPFSVHVQEVPRPKARRIRCSICNRLRSKGDDVWREPEDAVAPGETALVVHTVCPDCRRGIGMRRQSSIFRTVDL